MLDFVFHFTLKQVTLLSWFSYCIKNIIKIWGGIGKFPWLRCLHKLHNSFLLHEKAKWIVQQWTSWISSQIFSIFSWILLLIGYLHLPLRNLLSAKIIFTKRQRFSRVSVADLLKFVKFIIHHENQRTVSKQHWKILYNCWTWVDSKNPSVRLSTKTINHICIPIDRHNHRLRNFRKHLGQSWTFIPVKNAVSNDCFFFNDNTIIFPTFTLLVIVTVLKSDD